MTVRELLIEGEGELRGRETGRLEAQVLLAKLMKLTKEQFFCSHEEAVSDAISEQFFQHIEELKQGRPLAYILGEKEFYGLSFCVSEETLIPRPETEWLVERTIQLAQSYFSDSLTVADVGTGSGCIGVSVASVTPQAKVVLLDISMEALRVATENVERHGIWDRTRVIQTDLLNAVLDQKFDIILANLPYIGTERHDFVADDVRQYEPAEALFSGSDGFDHYRRLFEQILLLPEPPSYLLGEFGASQGGEMLQLLESYFGKMGATFQIVRDLAGLDRYFIVSFRGLPL